MSHFPSTSDPDSWHRYFAVENNNRAWKLSVQDRDPSQDQEMLNAAHCSAHHWSACGNELNQMRAKMLLAEVHACLGYGVSALQYAGEVSDYFLKKDTPDWELAFTHTIHAHAAHAAGEAGKYRAAHKEAVKSLDGIKDPEDRKIVLKTFDRVPKLPPGES